METTAKQLATMATEETVFAEQFSLCVIYPSFDQRLSANASNKITYRLRDTTSLVLSVAMRSLTSLPPRDKVRFLLMGSCAHVTVNDN